jgi:hypothetical protein
MEKTAVLAILLFALSLWATREGGKRAKRFREGGSAPPDAGMDPDGRTLRLFAKWGFALSAVYLVASFH